MPLKPEDYLLQQGYVVSYSSSLIAYSHPSQYLLSNSENSKIIYVMAHETSSSKPSGNHCITHLQDNSIIWCIGWQKNQGLGITILGGSQSTPLLCCLCSMDFSSCLLDFKGSSSTTSLCIITHLS